MTTRKDANFCTLVNHILEETDCCERIDNATIGRSPTGSCWLLAFWRGGTLHRLTVDLPAHIGPDYEVAALYVAGAVATAPKEERESDGGSYSFDRMLALHEDISLKTSARWAMHDHGKGSDLAQVYAPSMGPCRQVVPIAETTTEFGKWIVELRNFIGGLAFLKEAFVAEGVRQAKEDLITRLRADAKKRKAMWNAKPKHNDADRWLGEWSALVEYADVLERELQADGKKVST